MSKKLVIGIILFLVATYIAFEITTLFGIIFLISGSVSIFLYDDIVEKPGIPFLWLMGGLVARVALSDMLLPILKSETIIDFTILLFGFLMVYLVGTITKKGG